MALIHECLITLARRLRLGNDIAFLDYGCGAGEVVRMAMDRVDTVLHLTGMAHALSERHQDADGYQRRAGSADAGEGGQYNAGAGGSSVRTPARVLSLGATTILPRTPLSPSY